MAKSPRRTRATKASTAQSADSTMSVVVAKFWFGYDKLVAAMFYFSAVIILFMALAITYSVFMRRVLDSPVSWVIQLSEYMLLYLCFMAGPKILQEGGHARMTLVHERISPKNSTILSLFAAVCGVIICAVVVWQTGDSTWTTYATKSLFRENFNMEQWKVYWVVPFGFLLLGIEFARMTSRFISALKSGEFSGDGAKSSSSV